MTNLPTPEATLGPQVGIAGAPSGRRPAGRCGPPAMLLGLALALIPGVIGANDFTVGPIRILAAGSSSLYYHSQPKTLAGWLAAENGVPTIAELVGRSGTGVHVYLRADFQAEYGLNPGQTILGKITHGNYDFLLLQVPAEFINGPEGEEHDQALDVYCRAIRATGGEPVFYEMGWGRDERTEVGRQKILAAARRNRVTRFAPCSSAWARVRSERPGLDLQTPPDTTHPGKLGAYLNLCCLYAAFTGSEPEGLPVVLSVWHPIPEGAKADLAEQVRQRNAAGAFDPYDAALPAWMKRRVVASGRVEIPPDIARYLQGVAGAEHRRFQALLRTARSSPQGDPP